MPAAKYTQWLTDDGLLLLRSWARDGLTDEMIAEKMEIGIATLSRWKKDFLSIADALKRTREIYDNEVVDALHRRTLGAKVQVKKHFKVKEVIYDPKTGKKVSETEKIVAVNDEVYVPPDTMAQMYWLNNRMSEIWKARRNDSSVPMTEKEEAALIDALKDDE